MRKWLPTALLLGGVGVLAAFFIGLRMLLGPMIAQQPEAPAVVAVAEESSASSVPGVVTSQAPLSEPPAQPAVSPGIRFISRVIEPTYVVVAGDNLWSIAQRHNTTSEAIQAVNNLDRPALSIGQRLVIP